MSSREARRSRSRRPPENKLFNHGHSRNLPHLFGGKEVQGIKAIRHLNRLAPPLGQDRRQSSLFRPVTLVSRSSSCRSKNSCCTPAMRSA